MKFNTKILPISTLLAMIVTSAYGQVTSYQHCNLGGKAVEVRVGGFNWSNLDTVKNLQGDNISSIRVENGYKAILYAEPKCLDVVARSNGGAQNVFPYSCHGGNNQIWVVSKADKAPDEIPKTTHILPNYTGSQTVQIDCLVSGADSEETKKRITVTWFTAGGRKIWAQARNGISTCHGWNDKYTLNKGEEAAYVTVNTDGDDGYLTDQVNLFKEGKLVRTHGKIDSRGWCLSMDNRDHNKGDFNGHSVDSQCPSTRRFDC